MREVKIKTGWPIKVTLEYVDISLFEVGILFVICSIPNLVVYSGIGLAIYSLGQWLGGQL